MSVLLLYATYMLKKILLVAGALIALLIIIEICALLFMKSSVGRYAQYWKQRATVTPAGDRPFVYVALGDSTAQAIGATSPARGYVGLLASEIGAKTGRPVRVINLSKTGAKIDDVLNRQLPELKASGVTPDLITMEIGANNLLAFDASNFQSEYDQVLAQLPQGKTVVSDMPAFGGRIHVHGDDVAASKLIHQLAQRRGIPVAPLYDTLNAHQGLRIYAADYFHPSNYAYTLWRDAFWSKVEPLL